MNVIIMMAFFAFGCGALGLIVHYVLYRILMRAGLLHDPRHGTIDDDLKGD